MIFDGEENVRFAIRLCNPMTYVSKVPVKIIKIYIVKFNVSILNKLKIIAFYKYKGCK